ncbi:MAG TPA: hypothetical protein GX706_02370 [Candidatus Moranbacteria bacterium]|nr:hypothetical protein [Candidatus Moranbacteria bacterium]
MLLHFKAFLATLFFWAMLEVVAFNEIFYSETLLVFLGFSLVVLWPLTKMLRFLALPSFIGIGALSLTVLVSGLWEKQIIIALVVAAFYLSLLAAFRLMKYNCDQTAQGVLNFVTIVAMFLWFVAGFGWYLNLYYSQTLPIDVENWMLVIVIMFAGFFITLPSFLLATASCQILELKRLSRKKKNSYLEKEVNNPTFINFRPVVFLTIIVTLVVGQLTWVLSFWPFGYLTTGATLLIIYFMFWDVVRVFIQGKLQKNRLVLNGALLIFPLIMLLFTANWHLSY